MLQRGFRSTAAESHGFLLSRMIRDQGLAADHLAGLMRGLSAVALIVVPLCAAAAFWGGPEDDGARAKPSILSPEFRAARGGVARSAVVPAAD